MLLAMEIVKDAYIDFWPLGGMKTPKQGARHMPDILSPYEVNKTKTLSFHYSSRHRAKMLSFS